MAKQRFTSKDVNKETLNNQRAGRRIRSKNAVLKTQTRVIMDKKTKMRERRSINMETRWLRENE